MRNRPFMPMDPTITELAGNTRGFLDELEGARLYDLALAASRRGPCLEIGGYCGKSAVYLGSACRQNGAVLFSVDHHRGSEEQQPGEGYFDPELMDAFSFEIDTFRFFRQTLARADLVDTVAPIVCNAALAAKAWLTPLCLVFIDGGHAYETVLSDYRGWAPHVMTGGFLVFHDIYPNPADGGQAPLTVYRMALATGDFKEHPMTGCLGVLERL